MMRAQRGSTVAKTGSDKRTTNRGVGGRERSCLHCSCSGSGAGSPRFEAAASVRVRRRRAGTCASALARRVVHNPVGTRRTRRRRVSTIAHSTDRKERDDPNPFQPVLRDIDYYELLNVRQDADLATIKHAYRTRAKACHPDIVGDDAGQEMCTLLNEAYEVLSDEAERAAYDFKLDEGRGVLDDGYTGMPLSRWCGPGHPMSRAERPEDAEDSVFVDELACIGCQNCVLLCPAMFRIEPVYGRARVSMQWLSKREDIDIAIESCPVDCIHWVETQKLPALEFVMQNVLQRVDVFVMMAGQGGAASNTDVFNETDTYMYQRQRMEKEMMAARDRTRDDMRKRQEAAGQIEDQMDWGRRFMEAFGGQSKEKRRTEWQERFNREEMEEEFGPQEPPPSAAHEGALNVAPIPVEVDDALHRRRRRGYRA